MPEKALFPQDQNVSPFGQQEPHLPPPSKGGHRAGSKPANGITPHASYFPAHHPVGIMPSMKWNAEMFCGKSRSPRSADSAAESRIEAALRQPCEDSLLALPETANC